MWPGHHLRSELAPHFTAADLPVELRFGGHGAALRWLEPDDIGRLIQLFASHCEETVQRGAAPNTLRMSPDQAERLVNADQFKDVALGIFENADHEQRLIGLGRYCLGQGECVAEASFIVHDQRRGLGVATVLLHALLAIASERKIDQLVAHVRPDNAPMIHVLRAAGATFRRLPGAFLLEAGLRLHPPREPHEERAKRHAASWTRDVAARVALQLEHAGEALRRFPTP